ncbi:MAG: glycosyltransferase, partial [Tepidisphaeraceae bacterium]
MLATSAETKSRTQPAIPRILRRRPHRTRRTLVIFTQVFPPDPTSVGQHLADVAEEMVRRGWRVRVYTARHAYEDPSITYPKRENYRGVDVRRLPLSSFGKKSMMVRAIGTGSFMVQAVFRGMFTPNLAGVFFSTSPPLIGFAATVIRMF